MVVLSGPMTEPVKTIDAEAASSDQLPAVPADTNGSTPSVLAETEKWMEPAEDWPHQWLDFEGDKLAVRKPTQQALAAFSLACSRFVSSETRNDITGLFIARHLSPESYARVFSRLMDPDDAKYTADTVGELMRAIVELTTAVLQPPPSSKG